MAEKGFMLTQFEECFGKSLDHEVIKAVLQNVNWDAKEAVAGLTSLANMSSIPETVRAKIPSLQDLVLTTNAVSNTGRHNSFEKNVNTSNPIPSPCNDWAEKANKTLSSNPGIPLERNDVTDISTNVDETVKVSWPSDSSPSICNNVLLPGKCFKSNNSNVNCKVTNLSQFPSFTNEHRNYDKFLSNASHLKKGFEVSTANDVSLSNNSVPTDKPACMVQMIQAMVENGTLVMVLMRGLPGSGKSTLARKIAHNRGVVLSADDFFMTRNGQYRFDFAKLSEAHESTQRKARACVQKSLNPIVIDNTNLQKWEMRPYIHLALKHSYRIEFLEPDTSWKYSCKELARKTTHGVPKFKIEEMLYKFEKNLKLSDFNIVSERGVHNCEKPKIENKDRERINSVQNDIHGKNIEDVNDSNPQYNNSPLKSIVNSCKSESNEFYQHSRESSPPIITDQHFGDIVESLSKEMKVLLNRENPNVPISENRSKLNDDDAKMYQFCEDLEDKYGDTIPSMMRQKFLKEDENTSFGTQAEECSSNVADLSNRINTSLRAPDLATVTEELTKDLSLATPKEDEAAAFSDATSNDASSVELVRDNSAGKVSATLPGDWNCLDDPRNATWDDEPKTPSKTSHDSSSKTKRQPSRKSIHTSTSITIPDMQGSADVNDDWVANFKTDSWENPDYEVKLSELRKTGAVPKRNRDLSRQQDEPIKSLSKTSRVISSPNDSSKTMVHSLVQTNLEEILKGTSLKVLYGNGKNFTPGQFSQLSKDGPITRGNLTLDKGTMTLEVTKSASSNGIQHLQSFFPHIQIDSLKGILSDCKDDVNWAMNVLIDSGYEISEVQNLNEQDSQEGEVENEVGSSKSSEYSCSDNSRSTSPSRKKRTVKRRKNKRKYINLPSEDITHHSHAKSSKQVKGKVSNSGTSTRSSSPSVTPSRSFPSHKYPEVSASPSHYKDFDKVSIEMDSLFASQLVNIFGPVGNMDLNHAFNSEERQIYLPLNICKEIHSIWNASLKKDLEEEDRIIDDYSDASLALQMQMDEESKANSTVSSSGFGGFDCAEPPTNLREIMNMEKAIQKSLKSETIDTMSVRLSESRLCEEFSHVDAATVKEVLQQSRGKYDDAATTLVMRFGAVPAERKTPDMVKDSEDMRLLELKMREDMQLDDPTSTENDKVSLFYFISGIITTISKLESPILIPSCYTCNCDLFSIKFQIIDHSLTHSLHIGPLVSQETES